MGPAPFKLTTQLSFDGRAAPPPVGRTMAGQDKLPKLPIPPLADTMKRYLRALEGLQVSSRRFPRDRASFAVAEQLRPPPIAGAGVLVPRAQLDAWEWPCGGGSHCCRQIGRAHV